MDIILYDFIMLGIFTNIKNKQIITWSHFDEFIRSTDMNTYKNKSINRTIKIML